MIASLFLELAPCQADKGHDRAVRFDLLYSLSRFHSLPQQVAGSFVKDNISRCFLLLNFLIVVYAYYVFKYTVRPTVYD